MLILAVRLRIVWRARTLTFDIVGHDVLLAPWKVDAGLRRIEAEGAPRASQAMSMSNFGAARAEHHSTTARAATAFTNDFTLRATRHKVNARGAVLQRGKRIFIVAYPAWRGGDG